MGYDPSLMARKQIVQLGIKLLEKAQVVRNNYVIPRRRNVEFRPFEFKFLSEFNLLPLVTRKKIIDILNPCDKRSMESIKCHLKEYYSKLYNPNGQLSHDKIKKLLDKNLYSKEKVEKRKLDYEEIREKRIQAVEARAIRDKNKLMITPVKRRKKFSKLPLTPPNIREVSKYFGPTRVYREPLAKRHKLSAIGTPVKRTAVESLSAAPPTR